jgi:hypothetical protein
MSEPAQPPPTTHTADPIAVILARVEVKLDNALTEQSRHGTRLDRIEGTQAEHGNRLTALETRTDSAEATHERGLSAKTAFWTAVGSICIALTLLVSVWVQHK